MAFTTKDTFTFDHTAQADYPNWIPSVTKTNMNARGEELRLALNAVVNLLNATGAGASGAKNTAMTPIPAIGAQADVQTVVEAIVTRLQAVTAGLSGAKFIGVETIAGLTGNDVQTLLVALKTLVDGDYTVQTNALLTHKTSADHDGRYNTSTLVATTAGAGLVGATAPTGLTGTTVQALINALKTDIDGAVLGGVTDGSITDIKLSNTAGQIKDTVTTHLADYVRNPAYGPATGSVNAYTFSAMVATSLVDGMSVYLDNVIAANTGASTFNWSGLGAKAIVDSKGNALLVGKMPLNCLVGLRYNASTSSFQLLGEGGDYGTALQGDVRNTKTVGTANGVLAGTLNLSGLIPSVLLTGNTIDGVVGTAINGAGMKYFASGSGTTNGSNQAIATGLSFQPSAVEIHCGANYLYWSSIASAYDYLLGATNQYLSSVSSTGFSIGTSGPSLAFAYRAWE